MQGLSQDWEFTSPKYIIKKVGCVNFSSLRSRFNKLHLYLIYSHKKNLFCSTIINYWATFIAQKFKKTYKTS